MLGQSDVVKLLSKDPPPAQHEAFQILAAYIYCKSSRGNLPTETLSKVISIQRKILARGTNNPSNSPIGRAFEAAKTQLANANRKWVALGPRALGALGEVGSASSADAKLAWTKATDGKVTVFDDGTAALSRQAIDAGRVVGPAAPITEAPPMYQAPEVENPLTQGANVSEPNRMIVPTPDLSALHSGGSIEGDTQSKAFVLNDSLDVEAGRSNLAELRAARLQREQLSDSSDDFSGPTDT